MPTQSEIASALWGIVDESFQDDIIAIVGRKLEKWEKIVGEEMSDVETRQILRAALFPTAATSTVVTDHPEYDAECAAAERAAERRELAKVLIVSGARYNGLTDDRKGIRWLMPDTASCLESAGTILAELDAAEKNQGAE